MMMTIPSLMLLLWSWWGEERIDKVNNEEEDISDEQYSRTKKGKWTVQIAPAESVCWMSWTSARLIVLPGHNEELMKPIHWNTVYWWAYSVVLLVNSEDGRNRCKEDEMRGCLAYRQTVTADTVFCCWGRMSTHTQTIRVVVIERGKKVNGALVDFCWWCRRWWWQD